MLCGGTKKACLHQKGYTTKACTLFGGDSGARTYDLTDVNRAL